MRGGRTWWGMRAEGYLHVGLAPPFQRAGVGGRVGGEFGDGGCIMI